MPASAPALTRGLRILEYLAARRNPCGFNEILAELALPRASGARLLQVLCREGYALKVPGAGYRIGPALARVTLQSTVRERLAAEASAVLVPLREATGNTAALFQKMGQGTVVLDKAMHPQAVVMQPVGNKAALGPDSPWTAVIYDALPAKEQKKLDAAWKTAGRERGLLAAMLPGYAERGFAFDDAQALPGVRRLAAPVFDRDCALVACVALGGTRYTMPDDRVDELGAAVVAAGQDLSRRLGFRAPANTEPST